MTRSVRLDREGPQPSETTVAPVRTSAEEARRERIEEAQKKILESYAETFRRLAE